MAQAGIVGDINTDAGDKSRGDLYTAITSNIGGISAPVFGAKSLAEQAPAIVIAAGLAWALIVYVRKR